MDIQEEQKEQFPLPVGQRWDFGCEGQIIRITFGREEVEDLQLRSRHDEKKGERERTELGAVQSV